MGKEDNMETVTLEWKYAFVTYEIELHTEGGCSCSCDHCILLNVNEDYHETCGYQTNSPVDSCMETIGFKRFFKRVVNVTYKQGNEEKWKQ